MFLRRGELYLKVSVGVNVFQQYLVLLAFVHDFDTVSW